MLKKQCFFISLFIFLTALGCDRGPKADQIYLNGTILTMSGPDPAKTAEALAVKGEKILDVGSKDVLLKKYQSKKTKIHDLNGATLLPGFISSHMHFLFYGLASRWIDTSSINTFFRPTPGWQPTRRASEILEKVKEAAQKMPEGQWIPVWAFDPSRQLEDVTLDRGSLDAISNHHPILILNNSGHFAYVNTKALEILNLCGVLDSSSPGSCQKTSLTPSQLANAKQGSLMEEAVILALLQVIPKENEDWLEIGSATALKLSQRGYTTVSDGGVVGPLLKTYDQLTRNKDFPLNVVALPLSEFYLDEGPEGLMATWKKLGELPPTLKVGPVKFFADGSPQGYSAFMLQPYQSRPPWAKPDEVYRGEANDPELLKKGIQEVHRRGKQVAVHVNGDASVEMVLNILEEALRENPRTDSRHQLIHLPYVDTHPDLNQLKRIKEDGFVATFLSRNIYYWGQVLCQIIIGPQRVNKIYPAKKAGELGLKYSLHSDAPVNPPDPLQVIYSAVTRKSQPWDRPPTAVCPEVLGADQRISIGEALKAFTINAAHQFFLEKKLGSLEKEKFADFVVLSKNPLDFDDNPEELLNIDVLATVHHGRYRGWQVTETQAP